MPLFRENPVRSAAVAAGAVAVGHFITTFLASPNASQLVQSCVAFAAIGALVGLIVLHHRQEGQLLTQDQEEYILIGGLALTWIVLVTSWRAFGSGGSGGGYSGGSSRGGGGWGSAPKAGKGGPWDDYVVEEYYDWY